MEEGAVVFHATSARNDFYLATAQGLLGAIALRRGQHDEAKEHLNQARRIAATQAGTLVQVYVEGVSILGALRRGEKEQVAAELPAVLKLLETTGMTSHNCLDGYPSVVEVCLLTWQRASMPEAKAQLGAQYARAARALGRYALIFPIGKPALHLLAGRSQLACGDKPAALRSFVESQKRAEQLGMRHEAALAAAWHGKTMGGAAGRSETEAALSRLRALGIEELPDLDTP